MWYDAIVIDVRSMKDRIYDGLRECEEQMIRKPRLKACSGSKVEDSGVLSSSLNRSRDVDFFWMRQSPCTSTSSCLNACNNNHHLFSQWPLSGSVLLDPNTLCLSFRVASLHYLIITMSSIGYEWDTRIQVMILYFCSGIFPLLCPCYESCHRAIEGVIKQMHAFH